MNGLEKMYLGAKDGKELAVKQYKYKSNRYFPSYNAVIGYKVLPSYSKQ